ncbi:hypothetical protein AVEN_14582-1 [Araneus ventricosus]|uniref:Uncharacterized protein n=1 Tax=Araneus ventricosus TaxID=182803 RepID=A0A4Y2CFE7_ARAVE|nr:hypothetical protein AVEN_14582-1 [Araneus ventricosus]
MLTSLSLRTCSSLSFRTGCFGQSASSDDNQVEPSHHTRQSRRSLGHTPREPISAVFSLVGTYRHLFPEMKSKISVVLLTMNGFQLRGGDYNQDRTTWESCFAFSF